MEPVVSIIDASRVAILLSRRVTLSIGATIIITANTTDPSIVRDPGGYGVLGEKYTCSDCGPNCFRAQGLWGAPFKCRARVLPR